MRGSAAARALVAIAAALAAVVLAGAAAPQGKQKEDRCPWCKDDPKILALAGCVSHGPIPMGDKGGRPSPEVAARLPGPAWRFVETAHLRFGSSLGQEVVTLAERPRVEADLERLRKAFPDIPKKIQVLDPWLRLHLTASKSEELYVRFQKLLGVKDGDFPEQRIFGEPFMGNGRFLGEKEKFEVMIHAQRKTHFLWTEEVTGARVTDALRWHLKDPHKMIASIPAEDSDVRQDKFLFPHLTHSMTHLFFCAYKHFNWDPPVWLDEGIAHAMELESGKELNVTFCGDEGSGPDRERGKDWWALARGLAEKGKAPSLAELMTRKNFTELKKDDHVAAWSKVRFLADEHPEKLAKFLGNLKGRLDETGQPTNRDLSGFTRESLKELWGWTPDAFDREWEAWAKKK